MTIRVGILGAGAMGAEHAWVLGRMAGVEVRRVFSRDPARAAAAAREAGAEAVVDPSAVIDDPEIDAVDVCLPTPAHAPFVLAALRAGRHVFCETPLAVDLAEARRMRGAARKAGRLLQVGLLMRSIAACQLVKTLAETGEHGRLIHVSTQRLGSYLRAGGADHRPHYSDPTTELMTFDLDFLGWLFGRPTAVSAVAAGEQRGESAALLAFPGDRSASVLASGIMPAAHPFTAGFRAVFERAAVESRTVIDASGVSSNTRLLLDDAALEPPLPASNPYELELERFVACIRGEADPALLDVDRAIEALELSLAIQRSIRIGRAVRVSRASGPQERAMPRAVSAT